MASAAASAAVVAAVADPAASVAVAAAAAEVVASVAATAAAGPVVFVVAVAVAEADIPTAVGVDIQDDPDRQDRQDRGVKGDAAAASPDVEAHERQDRAVGLEIHGQGRDRDRDRTRCEDRPPVRARHQPGPARLVDVQPPDSRSSGTHPASDSSEENLPEAVGWNPVGALGELPDQPVQVPASGEKAWHSEDPSSSAGLGRLCSRDPD